MTNQLCDQRNITGNTHNLWKRENALEPTFSKFCNDIENSAMFIGLELSERYGNIQVFWSFWLRSRRSGSAGYRHLAGQVEFAVWSCCWAERAGKENCGKDMKGGSGG
jgi:hypothetical protein